MTLFRYSKEYFDEMIILPDGLLKYLGAFISQTYHYPYFGALTIVLISALCFYCMCVWIRSAKKTITWLSYILPYIVTLFVLSLFLYPSLGFVSPFPISFVVVIMLLAGISKINFENIRICVEIVALLLSIYICGSICAWFLVALLLSEWVRLPRKKWILFAIIQVGLFFVIPLLYTKLFIWKVNYFDYLANIIIFLKYLAYWPYQIVLLIIGICTLCATPVLNRIKIQDTKKSTFFFLTIVIFFSAYTFNTVRYREIENLNKAFIAADKEDWEEVLKLCDDYWFNMYGKERFMKEKNFVNFNNAINDYSDLTKFALCMTGKIPECFLKYAGLPGMDELFASDLSTHKFTTPIQDFYSSIGLQTEVLHVSLGIMTGNATMTTSAIKKYVDASLVLGDFSQIDIFLNAMSESLIYKDYAKEIRNLIADTAKLNNMPNIIAKRKLLPRKDVGASWWIDRNMVDMITNNPDNMRAAEYATWLSLFYFKEMQPLLDNLGLFKKEYKTYLPLHFEESLLSYIGYRINQDPELSPQNILKNGLFGYPIRESTLRRCDEFLAAYNKHQYGQMTLEELQNQYGDTYWFHLLFITINIPETTEPTTSYDI